MKPGWVFHKLSSPPPSRAFSVSQFRNLIPQNPSSEALIFSRNRVDILSALAVCGRQGDIHLGCSLHASILKNFEHYDGSSNLRHSLLVWNSLLSLYGKCGQIADAAMLFDEMPVKDTVSWNTMISIHLKARDFHLGFRFFKRLHESGVYRLDPATLNTLLLAYDSSDLCYVNVMLHGLVFLSGYEHEIIVGNGLLTSYFRCGCCSYGMCVFDEMLERNAVTWTAAISGLAKNQLWEDGMRLFAEMRGGPVDPNNLTYLSSLTLCSGMHALREGCQIHGLICKLGLESNKYIESALMDMYSKCGSMDDAWQIFESAPELDAISMTVILVGFAQNGLEEEAVLMFVKMVKAGIEIDPNMISAVLGVFGVNTSMALGKQMHSFSIKRCLVKNTYVSNGFINMYAKCGDLEDSIKVFNEMPNKSSISWNSLISAFAHHGDGSRALQLFENMKLKRVEVTDVTFLSLLHACSHVGLVKKGMEFLHSMTRVHGIVPRTEHYACVVDMLGRAGLLSEAKRFIIELLEKPSVNVWRTLLGACSLYGDSEVGKFAADQLLNLEPESAAPYVLMANIYSSEGRWQERAKAIKEMREKELAKDTGISWIEIDKKVHSFVVEDQMHPEAEATYGVLAQLLRLLREEGYVPDKRFILYPLDDDVKESGQFLIANTSNANIDLLRCSARRDRNALSHQNNRQLWCEDAM